MEGNFDKLLVSIGIPTYNRALTLVRAVESALAQDYDKVEIVISDNASMDETSNLCAELCKKDPRIRYLRQPTNLGMIENFRQVLAASHGAFFMWLSDDDWLDPSYISKCMHFLRNNEDYVLVSGKEKYYDAEEFVCEGAKMDLTEDSRVARVLSYYRQVTISSAFYGVARSDLLAGLRLQNMLGGDWLFSAAVTYLGKVKTLETISIHRSIAGSSQNVEDLGLKMGMSAFQARNAHLTVALGVLRDIGWRSPTYDASGRITRLVLGVRTAWTIIVRYDLPRRVGSVKRRVRAYSRRLRRLLDQHLLWRLQNQVDKHKDGERRRGQK